MASKCRKRGRTTEKDTGNTCSAEVAEVLASAITTNTNSIPKYKTLLVGYLYSCTVISQEETVYSPL